MEAIPSEPRGRKNTWAKRHWGEPPCTILKYTPPRNLINIDTKNDVFFLNVSPFKNWLFSVSMLVFGGVFKLILR